MPHRIDSSRYTRRINSNGENVAPSVCACYYKAPQRQADNSGGYVLDFFKRKGKKLSPIDTSSNNVVDYTMSQGQKAKEN